ncbi:MAG TPA: hypothetical protein VG125_01635 [Pirellulales bacterium]|jgi:xanthosine utilization system XapX-like protein|nr:hypothetical protein [Pirellulales bacterium]
MPLFFWAEQVPSIPAAMALAAVALIGYLVGRQSRPTAVPDSSSEKISRALADARQLEQITDEVLSVTREALDQCRKLRVHCQPPLTVPRPAAEHVSV